MQNLSVLKVSNLLHLIQEEKHWVKAALVGAERWAGSMAYTWAQESFRTHPETGSDEISSHMN